MHTIQWTVFSRKNACLALAILLSVSMARAQVAGSGTTGSIPVWIARTVLGNSPIVVQFGNDGGNVGIGTTSLNAKFTVVNGAIGSDGIMGSADGNGVKAASTTLSGEGNGLLATAESPNAVAIRGQMNSTAGGTGIWGIASSGNGNAGLFLNTGGGVILKGQSGSIASPVDVFRVDSNGKGFFDGGTQTGGADFAELIAVATESDPHEPGDLLVVDATGNRRLKLSSEPYSTLVAGIYSTRPGVLATTHKMNDAAANEIPLAIVGIVPCKVSAENGPIQPGDLLVSSSMPGYAMKGTDRSRMLGAVVGKALTPLPQGKGTIQVLVTLQ